MSSSSLILDKVRVEITEWETGKLLFSTAFAQEMDAKSKPGIHWKKAQKIYFRMFLKFSRLLIFTLCISICTYIPT